MRSFFLYGIPAFMFLVSIILFIILRRMENSRRRRFVEEAGRLGLTYEKYDHYRIPMVYRHLNTFSAGMHRYAFNLIHGHYKGNLVLAFDYQYAEEVEARFRKKPDKISILSLMVRMMDGRLPHLLLRPREMVEKFAPAGGDLEEVNLDAVAFSQNFMLWSNSPQFAREMLHPGFLEFLKENTGVSIEVCGNALAVHLAEILLPELLEEQLEKLTKIHHLIPQHLFVTNGESDNDFDGDPGQ